MQHAHIEQDAREPNADEDDDDDATPLLSEDDDQLALVPLNETLNDKISGFWLSLEKVGYYITYLWLICRIIWHLHISSSS